MLTPIIETVSEPAFSIQWQHVVVIILTGLAASGIILLSTSRSVRRIGLETARMVGAIQAAHKGEANLGVRLVAEGRGQVAWLEGGVVTFFAARLRTDAEGLEQAAADAVSALVQKLTPLGIEAEDIAETDPVMATDDLGIVTAKISVRDPANITKVTQAALSCSFTEERSGVREEITEDDVHRLAGERAVEDALRNLETLSASFRIDREALVMVSGDIQSVAQQEGRIVKIAKTQWIPAA